MPELEPKLAVFVAEEHVSARSLQSAVRRTPGPLLCVLPVESLRHVEHEPLKSLFFECRAVNWDRQLILATKDKRLQEVASAHGWRVVKMVKELRGLVRRHPSETEALRAFSPAVWRQSIRTRLQQSGILSLPKIRIWLLLMLSIGVFVFTFFKLLPSAEIFITPSQETESFTTNIYLLSSGAVLPVPKDRVRTLPLELLVIRAEHTLTYDQISKNFTGKNASMTVTIFNDSDEPYSLREGTRLLNQAGMRFRLHEDALLDPHSKVDTKVVADPLDQYGEVLGERGNVPAGIKWDFPGLTEAEKKVVYARNEKPAAGGSTSYVSVLTREDIEGTKQHPGARQRLEQELLRISKQEVEDEILRRNSLERANWVQLRVQLRPEDLAIVTFKDFVLPDAFIGQNVTSVPVQGSIEYTVVLYDRLKLLRLLADEVLTRIPPEKMVDESSLITANVEVHVIAPWDDDLRWIKITADLTYNQRFILDPITPSGAKFGKSIRDSVAGASLDEAYRIVKNFPEVSNVSIRMWPPWSGRLPGLGSSMVVTERAL